ncbi:MAG: ribonuclease P protein component 1 [Asgard group archaeon]|nr:ribonuclease P protein component 1 [Asgard group archaeon]
MSPISPNNIHQHELISLNVTIVSATDKQLLGLTGQVVDESKNLLMIELEHDKQKKRVKVLKKDCTFRFTLPSGEEVDVDGQIIKDKPENRLKNIIRKRW